MNWKCRGTIAGLGVEGWLIHGSTLCGLVTGGVLSSFCTPPSFAAPATAQKSGHQYLVIPGHSMGNVSLGATHAQVRKLWGRPYLIQRDGAYTLEFWHLGARRAGPYKAAAFQSGKVVQLETDSPRFRTLHGMGVNSKLSFVRQRLGKMQVISYGSHNPDPEVAGHAAQFYDSVKYGMSFDLGLGAEPDLSANNTPQAICVHRPGVPFVNVSGKQVWSEDDPAPHKTRAH